MNKLIKISNKNDIPSEYQQTPIGLFLEYHNLSKTFKNYSKAKLLTGMCMDNRLNLRIPDNFSYIIRTGGANLKYSEFNISYAVAVGGIKHIAILGHNNCGMQGLESRKEQFIEGLVNNAGIDKESAKRHFSNSAPNFEIGNETEFILSETKRLRQKYPKLIIAPMLYNLDDNRIYLIDEG